MVMSNHTEDQMTTPVMILKDKPLQKLRLSK